MKPVNRRQRGKAGLELIEEAVHLLRLAPAASLAAYYVGSLPFILGLLYFWADMSRSPYAAQHLAGASFGLALLFLWMKTWQAVFAGNLRAQISAVAPPRWSLRRFARILVLQAAWQPAALVALPLSAPVLVPFGWIFALGQNLVVLADGESPEVLALFKKSWRQAVLWPRQNHALLVIFLGFGACIFLNLVSVSLLLPRLLKMLLGIDSVYAQSYWSMLNTTFFAAMFGLTYLCLNPVVKAAYALRCFYGESIKSGEDLKAEIKQFRAAPARATAMAIVLALLTLAGTSALPAAEAPAVSPPAGEGPSAAPGVPPQDLDRAINDVIHQAKYTWRMPRETVADDDTTAEGPIGRFFERIWTAVKGGLKNAVDWLGNLLGRWLRFRTPTTGGTSSIDWVAAIKNLLILLLVLVVCGLLVLLFRVWQKSQRRPAPVATEAIAVTPDLTDENVGAEQLPEDGWIKLGRELLERGEFRLAMRAFYFASLAHLGARGLITIAKFKSNRDYEFELHRRGHALPDLLSSFGDNVLVFDRSWYGLHDVNSELVRQFLANVEKIKTV